MVRRRLLFLVSFSSFLFPADPEGSVRLSADIAVIKRGEVVFTASVQQDRSPVHLFVSVPSDGDLPLPPAQFLQAALRGNPAGCFPSRTEHLLQPVLPLPGLRSLPLLYSPPPRLLPRRDLQFWNRASFFPQPVNEQEQIKTAASRINAIRFMAILQF